MDEKHVNDIDRNVLCNYNCFVRKEVSNNIVELRTGKRT